MRREGEGARIPQIETVKRQFASGAALRGGIPPGACTGLAARWRGRPPQIADWVSRRFAHTKFVKLDSTAIFRKKH